MLDWSPSDNAYNLCGPLKLWLHHAMQHEHAQRLCHETLFWVLDLQWRSQKVPDVIAEVIKLQRLPGKMHSAYAMHMFP